MRKRKAKERGPDAQSVAFENQPGMQKLDATLREVLKIPKAEMDRREAEYRAARAKRKDA